MAKFPAKTLISMKKSETQQNSKMQACRQIYIIPKYLKHWSKSGIENGLSKLYESMWDMSKLIDSFIIFN